MSELNLFILFVKPLNQARIKYLVTGATAAIIYGSPRLTHDVDLIVDLKREQLKLFQEIFSAKDYYIPPEEIIVVEMLRAMRGHFNLIHHETGFKADIYLVGEDPLHHWALQHVRYINLEGEKIPVAPPEYVILRKLQFFQEGGSEKHLSDIKNILAVSERLIDLKKLKYYIKSYALESEWRKVIK
jgi:hypothetical protein